MPNKPIDPRRAGSSKVVRTKAATDRDRLLMLVADGVMLKDAIAQVGRHLNWYNNNRERYPTWAQAVTSARLAAKDPDLAGLDFVHFRQVYFDNYTAPHHYRMIEAFEAAAPGSLTVVLAFPGAGKTTLLGDKYCHLLAKNPDSRICVISEGQDLSRKIIGQVSDRMTDEARFPEYHLRYGPFKAKAWDDNDRSDRDALKRPWTADYFRILAARADEKEPSLESRGATGRMYGARYDWMIFDDVQSNESLEKTPKLLQSMRTTWHSRTILGNGNRGRSIMIGSRVGSGDIYETLDTHDMIDALITIPALTQNVSKDEHYSKIGKKIVVNPDCTAQPTWDRMSLLDLAEIRHKSGEEVWARTYMQDIVLDGASVFTEEMLEQAKDRTRVLGAAALGTERWGSIDPALDSGICAYLMTAISSDKMWVLDVMGRTDTYRYEDTFDWINTWSSKYRPSRWIVEQNNYQKGLLQTDEIRQLENRWRFDTYAHQTGRNKNDAVMGVRMMATSFANGEISIPWGDEQTIEVMQPLVDELRRWKPRVRGSAQKMDRVMALWFTWVQWQAERETINNVIPIMPRPSWVAKRRLA